MKHEVSLTEQNWFLTQRPEAIHVARDQKEVTHWINCRDSLGRAFPYKNEHGKFQGTKEKADGGPHSPYRDGLGRGGRRFRLPIGISEII